MFVRMQSAETFEPMAAEHEHAHPWSRSYARPSPCLTLRLHFHVPTCKARARNNDFTTPCAGTYWGLSTGQQEDRGAFNWHAERHCAGLVALIAICAGMRALYTNIAVSSVCLCVVVSVC